MKFKVAILLPFSYYNNMTFLEKLLSHYSLSYEEYKYMSRPIEEVRLFPYSKIDGVLKAKNRIDIAIANKEKIVIYGDYDCDGIMATSILVKAFSKLDYQVGYYIPSRYLDGYGLNKTKIDEFHSKNYTLIITVDNGITCVDEVSYAKSLGIDVIVTDHHEVKDILPDAFSIVHPIVSKMGEVVASGGAMAFYLASALLGYEDDYLLSMAMTSLISDLMELKDYNRDMVRLGLAALNKNQYQQFVMLNEGNKFDEKAISMKIAPKINAVGRMVEDIKVNRLVKFFVSDNIYDIRMLFNEIENLNNARKELTTQTVESLRSVNVSDSAIVLKLDIKEGLIGLISNRLLNDYNKPTVIFTSDNKDETILKGSARSKEGFNITKAFKSLDKYLLTGGGHAMAGGLSIKKSDFDAFKKDFILLADNYPLIEVDTSPIEISLLDINKENFIILNSLSPFGVGLIEPDFKIKEIKTSSLVYISNNKHICTPISLKSRLLGFNFTKVDVDNYQYIDVIGNYRINEFRGNKTLDFVISKIKETNK